MDQETFDKEGVEIDKRESIYQEKVTDVNDYVPDNVDEEGVLPEVWRLEQVNECGFLCRLILICFFLFAQNF